MKSPEDHQRMLNLTSEMMLREPYKSHSAYGAEFRRDWDECENIARFMLGWRPLWFWAE